MSYEQHSPASNASSYLNQNLKSVDNHMTNSQLPEVHALIVNIFLSDSLLNLFKDSNFNSCPICVCNTNIKGSDVGLYLPDRLNETQYRCTCGFSAAVNRALGFNSGLFYEDEVEITNIRNDRFDRRKPSLLVHEDKEEKEKAAVNGEIVPQNVLTLLQGQFSALYPSPMVLQSLCKPLGSPALSTQETLSMLELADGCDAAYAVLEVGRQAMEHSNTHQPLSDPVMRHHVLSKWPFFKSRCLLNVCTLILDGVHFSAVAKVPLNSQDVVRMLKSLQPLLQDAIHKKRTTRVWESVYTISGPLSWKDFHLLAGRGSEERSEPQPIPALTVSNEKDALSIGHHALKFWVCFFI
jgi:mediator of RNA polymerase II transcription subunit 13